jgi:transcriptional regulator with XRE-family HTH domain
VVHFYIQYWYKRQRFSGEIRRFRGGGVEWVSGMPKIKPPASPFGERLLAIRKAKGISQTDLARMIGASQRAVSYYEVTADYPPVEAVIALAKALGVSTDELLGVKPLKEKPVQRSSEELRLWQRVRKMASLPDRDQRAITRMISLAVAARRRKAR